MTTAETTNGVARCIRPLDRSAECPAGHSFSQPDDSTGDYLPHTQRVQKGNGLRAIATAGDQSYRTAKVIAWIRANYTKTLRVEDLAHIAGMSMSTLHHHFRVLTSMSPLQYQKQLRLQAARQRMLIEGLDAASAAFSVGYESASQFNREYSRFFGQPPIRDVRTFRSPNAPGLESVSHQNTT